MTSKQTRSVSCAEVANAVVQVRPITCVGGIPSLLLATALQSVRGESVRAGFYDSADDERGFVLDVISYLSKAPER